MNIITLDFETYFDDTYSLSKGYTTESYIRDSKFEAHGCAIKFAPDMLAKWWSQDELPGLFQQIDWSNVFLIAHHMQFDGLILSHHYGVVPKMYGCTLSMARLMVGNHISVGLDSLSKYFNFPTKTIDYLSFKGKHWDTMDERAQRALADGCVRDVEITSKLFGRLLRGGPR